MAIRATHATTYAKKQSLLAGLPNLAKGTQSRDEKRTDKQVLIYFKNNDRAGDGVSATTTNPFVVERRTLPGRKKVEQKKVLKLGRFEKKELLHGSTVETARLHFDLGRTDKSVPG